MKQTTVPRSPKFTKTASRGVRRDYMNEQTQQNFYKSSKSEKKIPKPDDTVNPSTTKATKLAMQKRREEIQAKLRKENEKAEEERKRKERQN